MDTPLPLCTHIKVTGHRCGSPALRKQLLCYFHARVLKGVDNRIDAVNDPDTIFENAESVQCALIKVFNMLLRGTIDLKPAASNLKTAKFETRVAEMVTEVPNYNVVYMKEHPGAKSVPLPNSAWKGEGIHYPETSDMQVKDFRKAFIGAQKGYYKDMKYVIKHLASQVQAAAMNPGLDPALATG
jgi:hypothetical protein